MLYGSIVLVTLGSRFPVHGPRQDGRGTPIQVLCSRMGSILSLSQSKKLQLTSQTALPDKASMGLSAFQEARQIVTRFLVVNRREPT